MKLIDLVPLDREWPETKAMADETQKDIQRLADLIQDRFPELPIRNWRKTGSFTVAREYHHLTCVRDILDDVLHNPVLRKLFEFGEGGVRVNDWPEIKAPLVIDPITFKFKLSPESDEIAKTFIGADIRYLRGCAICGRPFWAKREKSITCGSRCGSNQRKRRERGSEKKGVGPLQPGSITALTF